MIKVLIVDDSVFSQKVLANSIKKYLSDIDISFANDGEQGLLKYKELNPDFVFLDLLMPKISGQDLIPMIQEYDADAKIFVVSADVQKNIREEVEQYKILAFVNKPLSDEKSESICNMMRGKAYD